MSERGSARLLERWFGEPTIVEEEHLLTRQDVRVSTKQK